MCDGRRPARLLLSLEHHLEVGGHVEEGIEGRVPGGLPPAGGGRVSGLVLVLGPGPHDPLLLPAAPLQRRRLVREDVIDTERADT